jgi:lipopolysaccharide export system protein LptA
VLLAGAALALGQTPPSATPSATPPPLKLGLGLDQPLVAPTTAPDGKLTEEELMNTLKNITTSDPLAPKKPLSAYTGKKGKTENTTEITAMEATFDQKSHQAVFLRDVFVDNPEFSVNCDKLTAFLKHSEGEEPKASDDAKGAAKPEEKPAAATPAPKPDAGPKGATRRGPHATAATAKATPAPVKPPEKVAPPTDAKTGGLDKAIAEGNVVIIQDKVEADGTVSHNLAHAKKAVYEAGSGDITLYGHPDAARGVNTVIALEEGTIIIMNRDGRMHAVGPHKTTIKDNGDTSSNAR